MASSWNSAIDAQSSVEAAMRLASSTDESQLRIARIQARKKQIATLFGELGEQAKPEIKSLLLDIASQVEGLCSIALEPGGFSLISFNEKRSELRVELDKSTSRASLLIPSLQADARMKLLDGEVESEQNMMGTLFAEANKVAAAKKHAEKEAAAPKKQAEKEAAAAKKQAEQEAAAAQRQREAEIRARNQPAGTWWDERTGLLWTPKDNGSDITWDNAKSYCDGLTLGGSSDWRIPTIAELKGLYDASSPELYKTRVGVEVRGWVWSGDLNPDDSSGAWDFLFLLGGRRGWNRRGTSDGGRALCVRRAGG